MRKMLLVRALVLASIPIMFVVQILAIAFVCVYAVFALVVAQIGVPRAMLFSILLVLLWSI